jgi:hypothetical protein
MSANQIGAGAALDAPEMDYPAHLASYRLFTSLMKWGVATVVFILLLLAFLTL